MTGVLQQLDSVPRPFVFIGMILGFILFWPIGLAVLAYLFWSKRMGCASPNRGDRFDGWAARNQHMAERWERKSQHFMERMNAKMERWGVRGQVFRPTGNAAFDEYREETLRRLEDEADEFNASCPACAWHATRPSSTSTWPNARAKRQRHCDRRKAG